MKAIVRETKETTIRVGLGKKVDVATGLRFFDHMLTAFSTYAGLPLEISAKGDLVHHTMEDTALAVGAFIRKITPTSCARYGERTIPMDDALVSSVIDIGGRAFFVGKLPSRLYTHWFRSFATASESTLHLRVIRGGDRHHLIEAAFKSTGLALRQAMRAEGGDIFSTKGSVRWRDEE
ncbi:MAG: imidazoleglycerol-phosphate dehydratase [Polyangiaceae bacterium]